MQRRYNFARHCLLTALFTLLILPTAVGPALAGELRTWTDKSGQHRIEAEFVSEVDGKVILKNKDGKQFEIALSLLAEADQKHIQALKEQLAADNPFRAMETPAADADAAQPRVVSVDLSRTREVAPLPENSGWKLDAPAASPIAGDASLKPIAFSSDGFKYEGIAVSAPSKRVLLSFSRRDKDKYSDPDNQIDCRYVLGDVTRGRVVEFEVGPLDATMRAMALNRAGNAAIALRTVWGFGNSDRLEHWSLTKTGVQRELQWIPYEESKGGNRDVKWVQYLEGDRAVTVSGGGTLVVWDLKTAQPIYRFAIKGGSTPGLSPDGKLICYSRGTDVGILDVDKGMVIAAQDAGGNLTWPNLRFSPDGNRIACLDHHRLKVWDFQTGHLVIDTPRLGFPTGGYQFVSSNHLLLNKNLLFDIENQLIVWSYTGAAGAAEFGESCCLVASGSSRRPGLVMFERLPQPVVTDTLAAAMQDPQFWVLARGTTVQLDLTRLPDRNEQRRIGTLLTQKLAELGMQVGNNGTIRLVASVQESPQKKEVSYSRGFSPFGRGVPMKVREFKSKLTFLYQGTSAWEQSGTNVPGSLSLKDGEAITDALRRHEFPNYAWFDRVELPVVLRKPTGSPTLGTTRVTDAGLR